MPIYEYRCLSCQQASSVFARSMLNFPEPVCSHCGSAEVRRTLSSFAYHKSSPPRSTPDFDAPNSSLEYYSDPKNVGRRVEESFNSHGVEMPGEVRETIDAARQGKTPKGLDI